MMQTNIRSKAVSRLLYVAGGLFSTTSANTPTQYTPTNYVVMGFPTCPYYRRASQTAVNAQTNSNGTISAVLREFPRDEFHTERAKVLRQLGMQPDDHRTCPLVYLYEKDQNGEVVPKQYIGGSDKFDEHLRSRRV